ncbi:DMT family transporter [Glaciihabitans sp. dw_435]|uniref:DMT family transporter n=1 Tax=Glaciihabitans sp. dw_435 TaxID=2720081 RepID=UPI001BD5ABAD|nr:DMT family transporter [Glaciihabitans sp. dw_435]
MITAALGLTTAFFFGSADFLGGFASRQISAIRVTALSAAGGLVAVCLIVPFLGGQWSAQAILWGAIAGGIACLSVSMLYAALAIGPMSVLSPLIAVISAVVPMTVGLLTGERFGAAGYLGLALALAAVILVGLAPERTGTRPSTRGILLAVGAGTSIGAGLVTFNAMPPASGFVPLIVGRTVTVIVMFAAVGVIFLRAKRSRVRATGSGWRGGFWYAVGGGVLSATADAVMLTGVRLGELSVMAVLVALYAGVTVILAAVFLHERITRLQAIGLTTALVAVALLALG